MKVGVITNINNCSTGNNTKTRGGEQVFDIGIGEIVIMAILGLLIFGPERMPKAAADAAKWLNQMKTMASGARKDLAESAGVDLAETTDMMKSLQEFHPKRIASSLLNDEGPASRPEAVGEVLPIVKANLPTILGGSA